MPFILGAYPFHIAWAHSLQLSHMCFGRNTCRRPVASLFLGVSLDLKTSLKIGSWLLSGTTDPVYEMKQKQWPPARHQPPLSLPKGEVQISEAGLELRLGSGQGTITGHDLWPLGRHQEAVPLSLGLACVGLRRKVCAHRTLPDSPWQSLWMLSTQNPKNSVRKFQHRYARDGRVSARWASGDCRAKAL